jgi:serine/threonine protein kinase
MDQATFLDHLRRSKLLSPEQIGELADRHPGAPPAAIARALVAKNLLTAYQAQQLLAGNARGFLLGPYRILDFLGQGSAGSVFRAEHITLGRVAAIKVFKPEAFASNEAYHFFQREVQATALLDHPNLVTAYDAGESRGVYFLVMEYVDGPSLRKMVRRDGPLPVGLACEIVRQTALGLQYAHERGMVHRDIKPANLLIRHAPGWKSRHSSKSTPSLALGAPRLALVKVLDFGLARLGNGNNPAAEAPTLALQPKVMIGTADYISPEQADDVHAVDIRSDLYSLGCTFYFALSGEVPFPGSTALEKLVKRLTEEPAPLRDKRPEVPAAVSAIVQRLMARDPSQRFQTPAEVAEALGPYCVRQGPETSKAEVATRYSLNTPADSDAEPGTGWVLELAFPREDDTAAQPPAPASGQKRRNRPRGKWKVLLAAVAALILTMAVLALLYWTRR